MKKLEQSQIDDPVIRENFNKLQGEADLNPFINGGFKKVFEKNFTAAGTLVVNHNLGFIPSDYIKTFDSATVSFSNFTNSSVTLTSVTAGKVRFLLGRMK